jgi:hypothetical protein
MVSSTTLYSSDSTASAGVRVAPFSAMTRTSLSQGQRTPIGDSPLGQDPLGGDTLDPVLELPGADVPMQRFYQIDTCSPVDYTEHFVEYSMDTLGGQFAIVAHGSNQFDAGTAMITNKK